MGYVGVVAVEQFLEVFVHLLVIHLQLHALALELPTHLADLLRVLAHLFCLRG